MVVTMPITNQSCYLLQYIDNMRPSNPLSIILDNNRLTGPNSIDWLRSLKVILASEKILYVIEQSLPTFLPENSSQEEHDVLQKWKDDDTQARCIIWASMISRPEIQRSMTGTREWEYIKYPKPIVSLKNFSRNKTFNNAIINHQS